MTFNKAGLFFLIIHLVGCHTKVVQRNPHEQEKPETVQRLQNEDLQDCKDLLKSKMFSERLCDYQNQELAAEEAKELYEVFSKTDFLRDPEIFSRTIVGRLVWSLNNFAIQKKDANLVRNLVTLMRRDCQVFEKDACLNYKVFFPVNNTRDIFLSYLQDNNNKQDLTSVFILAFRSANSTTDTRIFKILARRISELQTDERLVLILKTNQRDDLDDTIVQKINSYIYPDQLKIDGKTSVENIVKAIEQSKKATEKDWLSKSWLELKKRRPQLAEALSISAVEVNSVMDIYDLIFEKVLTDREASQSLLRLASEEQLLSDFKKYTQMRLAVEIDKNDQSLRNIVEKNNATVNSSESTQRLYENLETIRRDWRVMASQLADVSLWVSSVLSTNKSEPKKYLSGMDATIRAYSEYPHMMYLAYINSMQGIRWETVDFGPSGNLQKTAIGTKKLFANIFFPPQGKMYTTDRVTWLRYTNLLEANKQVSIKNSLLYFLSSGAFDVFKIDKSRFFTFIVSNLYQEYINLPRQRIENVSQFYEYNSEYKDYRNFCEDFMAGKPVRRVIQLEDLRKRFLTAGFSENILQPISFGGDANVEVGGSGGGLPFDLTTVFDLDEYATTDLGKVEDLLLFIQKSLQRRGQPTSTEVDMAIVDLKQLRKVAKNNISLWKQRGLCFAKILKEERSIFHYVVEQEVAYMRQAYRDMKSLELAATPLEAKRILDKYKKTYLFEPLAQRGIQPLDRVSTKGYFYSQFDLFGRIAYYLQSYSPNIKFEIQLPENIAKARSYSLTAKGLGQANWFSYSFSLSEEKLINEVYRTFQNESYFVGWNDVSSIGSRLDRYQMFMSSLISASRFVKDISGDVLLGEYKKMLQYLQLTDLEKKLLAAASRETLWLPIQLDGWFVDVKFSMSSLVDKGDLNISKDISGVKKDQTKAPYLTRIYGLFDILFEEYNEDVLGFDYYVKRLRSMERTCEGSGCGGDWESSKKYRAGPYGKAVEFYLSLQNVETRELIYPLDQTLVRETYSALRSEIEEKERRSNILFDEIQKVYSPKEDYIDISLSLQVSAPAVSLRSKSKVEGNKADFHLQTQNCFRPGSNKKCLGESATATGGVQ